MKQSHMTELTQCYMCSASTWKCTGVCMCVCVSDHVARGIHVCLIVQYIHVHVR